jgi:hypothetical protein
VACVGQTALAYRVMTSAIFRSFGFAITSFFCSIAN